MEPAYPQYQDTDRGVSVPPRQAPATRKRAWLTAAAYLPEFIVMLVMLVTVASSINTLITVAVDSYTADYSKNSSGESYYYGSDNNTWESHTALAALFVALPIFVWLFIRARSYEANHPAVSTNKWRRGFLGAAIAYKSLILIWGLMMMAFTLLTKATGASLSTLFFSFNDARPWWAVILAGILCSLVTGYVVWRLVEWYRSRV